jgi:hypothetical protein
MAGLDPAIYTGTVPRIVTRRRAATDGRVKPGHDDWGGRCKPSASQTFGGLILVPLHSDFDRLRGGLLELRVADPAVQRVKIAMLAIIGRKFGTW